MAPLIYVWCLSLRRHADDARYITPPLRFRWCLPLFTRRYVFSQRLILKNVSYDDGCHFSWAAAALLSPRHFTLECRAAIALITMQAYFTDYAAPAWLLFVCYCAYYQNIFSLFILLRHWCWCRLMPPPSARCRYWWCSMPMLTYRCRYLLYWCHFISLRCHFHYVRAIDAVTPWCLYTPLFLNSRHADADMSLPFSGVTLPMHYAATSLMIFYAFVTMPLMIFIYFTIIITNIIITFSDNIITISHFTVISLSLRRAGSVIFIGNHGSSMASSILYRQYWISRHNYYLFSLILHWLHLSLLLPLLRHYIIFH